LIPSWAKDRKVAWKFINARAERVATTGAFKTAFAKRRCLVPVDGFYEWRTVGKVKQPHRNGGRAAVHARRAVEELKDPDTRGVGSHLHDRHGDAERACREAPSNGGGGRFRRTEPC
jgi:hypothetical protein